jgi:hypothetical protein
MSFDERARLAARARWGPTRVHNIRDLSPEQREVVDNLVRAFRQANEVLKATGR